MPCLAGDAPSSYHVISVHNAKAQQSQPICILLHMIVFSVTAIRHL